MGDSKKSLLGLLNGIARHDYYGEKEITNELLKEELFPKMSIEDYTNLLQKIRGVVKSMASTDMDLAQAEAFLISQTKKRDGGITEDQSGVLLKFWKSHKTRIHDSLIDDCTWNNRLKALNWRVDVKSRMRSADQISAPCAIVEMLLENRINPDTRTLETVQFELDESNIANVVRSLNDIEALINQHCNQSRDDQKP